MTEANNIDTFFDSKLNFGSVPIANNDQADHQNEAAISSSQFSAKNNHLPSESLSTDVSQADNGGAIEHNESLAQKMNWQKVAHKLREYNRKLLKKVFRLEQELAEIDNKFNKHVEKSQNSDLLVAKQAEEIKKYEEKIALLSQQLTSSEQQISNQKTIISDVSQQYESSQKQTAQLERDCTLLQENYNQKTYELITKEQETKELQTKLSQQQRCAMEYQAELQRYIDKAKTSSKSKLDSRQENLPSKNLPNNNRSIKPWSESLCRKTTELPLTSSTSTNPEPKISLPQTKPQPVPINRLVAQASETVKPAAKIPTWAETQSRPKDLSPWITESPLSASISTRSQNQVAKTSRKSSTSQKPQSLAAVDLPTFPRQS